MLRTSVALSARGYGVLRFAPTNLLINAIRTKRGLKWGVPAMLLAVPYLYAAAICTTIINDGGPGWLHLLVLLFVWDAFKLLWIGPVSLVQSLRERVADHRQRATLADNTQVIPRGRWEVTANPPPGAQASSQAATGRDTRRAPVVAVAKQRYK